MTNSRDRVILVTGASGELGHAVSRIFLEGGATLVAISKSGRSPEPDNPRVISLAADLASPSEAAEAVERAGRQAGHIDALIHVAGGFAGGEPVPRTDDATWKSMMDMNLNSAFYTARAALPLLLPTGHGRIVAVGSRTAVEPAAGLSAYGASKAGLVALIRTIALEVKDSGATANVVLPSVIDTPANRRAMPKADHSKWVKPESIARLIAWLASGEAADVNGAAIPIYGRA